MNYFTSKPFATERPETELKNLAAYIGDEKDPSAQAYYQLRIVYNLLNKVGSVGIENSGVHTAYYGVLYALRGGRVMTPSQLRHFVLSGVSNLTSLIDRMVRDGLVRRWHDEQDRRQVKICLTERGEEAGRLVIAEHVDWIKKTMSVFDEQDLEQFTRLLELLWQSVRSQAVNSGIEIAGTPAEVEGDR